MRSALLQHLRIAAQYARVGIVRKSQFRVEFWCQVIMDCCWYGSHVAVFEVLYMHAPDIAGWKRDDFRVLLGFLFVSDAFMMIWLSQMWRFGSDLKDGRLDSYRVRPAATLFIYAFQLFSPEGCMNMAIALAYLTYGVQRASPAITPLLVAVTLLCIVLSFWVRVSVVTAFALFEFWLVGSDASRFVHEFFHATTDRPAEIFGARARMFLLYVVPVGALSQVPAEIVLGRHDLLSAATAFGWLFGFGLLVFAAWNRSFRRYESAMG